MAKKKAKKKATIKKKTTIKKKIKKVKPKCLSNKDLRTFKEKINNTKEQILYQIQDLTEDTLMKTQKDISGDISGYGLHMADVASDNYEREFSLGLASNERRTLLEIEEALKRVEDKTYGVCQMCNKFIAKTRLKAIPYARCCAKCQNTVEKENRI